MRQGHFKVAAHYVRYRDDRSRMRELQTTPAEDPNQESFVTVTRDGQSDLWNGQELKKRIQFASIGLKLTMGEDELERELRRSIGAEISAEDLQKTICLNARALIEKDADMAKFAGRILLSYIYEEVLNWNIISDGIEGLKAAHKKAFRSYLKHGVKIKRLSPDLLDGRYDIPKLANALDPTADLDFDYLGIQTLSLIHI